MLNGPRAGGSKTGRWTLTLISELIQKKFGVEHHPDHPSRFTRQQGCSRHKPAVRGRERDEATTRKFVREEFPRLESARGVAAPR